MVDSSQIPYAIAIDFDGILCQNAYPDIGDPNWDTIHQALKEQSNGAKLILWTCRGGRSLERAVAAGTTEMSSMTTKARCFFVPTSAQRTMRNGRCTVNAWSNPDHRSPRSPRSHRSLWIPSLLESWRS